MNQQIELSLLWKHMKKDYFQLNPQVLEDLNLTDFFVTLKIKKDSPIYNEFLRMPTNPENMVYRQDIFRDLIEQPNLLGFFRKARERTIYLTGLVKFAYERESTIYNLLKRVEEAEDVMDIVEYLYGAVSQYELISEGFNGLKVLLSDIITSTVYDRFKKDLAHIKKMDGNVRSIYIGMNFDENLKPKEAIVMSVNEEPVKYTRVLKKADKMLNYGINSIMKLPRKFFAPETLIPKEELNELEKLIEPAIGQLIKFCDLFNESVLKVVTNVLKDLDFYEMMMNHYQLIQSEHIHMTKPIFTGRTALKQVANLNLLYKMIRGGNCKGMVFNDVTFEDKERCFVLTGANRGGKTTITQAIGQLYLLSQLGFFLPGVAIELKPITQLFTVFPREEVTTVEYGRLGEECHQFSQIYQSLDSEGLLLMNETFSGTSHLESLFIAKEIMKALQLIGTTVIYNTHLHELVMELNDEIKEAPFVSWVTGSEVDPSSFLVRRAMPLGKSYAAEIALKFGVSFEQLVGDVGI